MLRSPGLQGPSPAPQGAPRCSAARLPAEKALSVLHHIAEGGVRKTSRLVGVNREAVARYGKKVGAHAAASFTTN